MPLSQETRVQAYESACSGLTARYVNIWVNNFRRWQKRWLVASTPGVLVIYRRSSRLGAFTTIDLTTASVVVGEKGVARQFLVVTGRSLHSSTSRLNSSAFCGIGVHLGVV